MPLLTREPTGNVVLNSGDADIRFFREYGGAPLEFWRRNYPGPITNSWPGSGVSVAWNTGQDPTQASANGVTKHPICCFGLPHTQQHNYYIRESVFDAAGIYEVSGFAPDFWLSAEGIDDYPCPPVGGWSAINTALNFSGSPATPSGIYCPGNEMEPGQIRRYPGGRVAFKVKINFATPSGIAGILFRKAIPEAAPTKDNFYSANGYHLNVNQSFGWELRKQAGGIQTVLAGGGALPTPGGVVFEVRTHNNVPGHIEVHINGAPIATVIDPSPVLGDALGCFATCTAGTISFLDRQVFDLGVTFQSRYKSLGGGAFRHDVTIRSDYGPRKFYRANPQAAFLNPGVFASSFRSCEVLTDGGWSAKEGAVTVDTVKALWAGNPEGTLGLKLSEIAAKVDGKPAPGAHAFLSREAHNQEFVLMFNPLPLNAAVECSEIKSSAVWSVTK